MVWKAAWCGKATPAEPSGWGLQRPSLGPCLSLPGRQQCVPWAGRLESSLRPSSCSRCCPHTGPPSQARPLGCDPLARWARGRSTWSAPIRRREGQPLHLGPSPGPPEPRAPQDVPPTLGRPLTVLALLAFQTLPGLFAQLSGPAPLPLPVLKIPLLVVRKAIWRGGGRSGEGGLGAGGQPPSRKP